MPRRDIKQCVKHSQLCLWPEVADLIGMCMQCTCVGPWLVRNQKHIKDLTAVMVLTKASVKLGKCQDDGNSCMHYDGDGGKCYCS